MRHIPGPAIVYATLLAASLPTAMSRPAAAAVDLDWQVSLSGEVALSEVRFGKVAGWTCTTGSLTATAASGSCTGKPEGGWFGTDEFTDRPPMIAFIVKPTFPVHLPDSPTGIPGAPVQLACPVAANLTSTASQVRHGGFSPESAPDISTDDIAEPGYCNHLNLVHAGGNAWTLTYSGPTTSEGVMQD
ncbi:hypothetical protein ACFOGJ_09555 [Marinibaculum pumilum]|uniref:Uncharacterized protein n=1 Tax=Marinibaculum pumilum TaxID=1766165 RepID=A0ABV7KZ86_9PROT